MSTPRASAFLASERHSRLSEASIAFSLDAPCRALSVQNRAAGVCAASPGAWIGARTLAASWAIGPSVVPCTRLPEWQSPR